MTYLHVRSRFRNDYLDDAAEASWPAIVDLIFSMVAHRDRLALKRKALGRQKRKLVRKQKLGERR